MSLDNSTLVLLLFNMLVFNKRNKIDRVIIIKHKGNETMDADTRKSIRTDASKPLNMPESLSVEENPAGLPTAVKLKQRHRIITIEDYRRIDDEWWRSEPISRIYYAVTLDSGRRMVLCHNLIDNRWCSQSY
jgi:hypothetical protein